MDAGTCISRGKFRLGDKLHTGSPSMQDLETEIFLHLLQQHRSALAGLAEDAMAAAAKATASSSDGMAPVRWLFLPTSQSELHSFPRDGLSAAAPDDELICPITLLSYSEREASFLWLRTWYADGKQSLF